MVGSRDMRSQSSLLIVLIVWNMGESLPLISDDLQADILTARAQKRGWKALLVQSEFQGERLGET
jgi:hypothetical protein